MKGDKGSGACEGCEVREERVGIRYKEGGYGIACKEAAGRGGKERKEKKILAVSLRTTRWIVLGFGFGFELGVLGLGLGIWMLT